MLAVIGSLIKRWMNKKDENDEKMEKELNIQKLNYIERFAEIKDLLGDQHTEVVESLATITTEVKNVKESQDKQEKFCRQVQQDKIKSQN
jgi:uncharacterized membrane-anchored protein YhcB (DUF1043 family)